MTFVSFQHAGQSDIGARSRQEDAFGIKVFQHAQMRDTKAGDGEPDQSPAMELIAVLADGMGGHVGGARASKITCGCFMTTYPKIEGPIDKRLLLSLDASNKSVAAAIDKNHKLQGMGCTLVGVSIDPTGVHWISVGDSLLYLYHNKRLSKLNEDHSLAPVLDDLVTRGEMTSIEARHHPKRNMLRSAIGGEEIRLVDLNREVVPLTRGDWLILASDGLGTLTNDQIAKIIDRNAERNADQIVQALLKAVKNKARPDQDNTTVLAIGFDKTKTRAP